MKESVFRVLTEPSLPSDLAINFNRSKARIQEVLVELKKEGKINNFRVGSIDYWIRNDKKVVIISKVKRKYLNLLASSNKTTTEIANYFNVGSKSSFRRLRELEKLGLVKRKYNKKWEMLNPNKKVIVL